MVILDNSVVCPFGFAGSHMKEDLGFCADLLPFSDNAKKIGQPRSIVSVGNSDFLFLDRASGTIKIALDRNEDGWIDEVGSLGSAHVQGLNHGLALHPVTHYVYASTATDVYRWSYDEGLHNKEKRTVTGPREHVISTIEDGGMGGAPGGHKTRTLAFSKNGTLYMSIGSFQNVDTDSGRSRIRRFTHFEKEHEHNIKFPLRFVDGEVFADGLRNEVGLAFDTFGVLWGVENSADNLKRADLGGDIHNENPAEELNRFPENLKGKHWGYPYCWTEFKLPIGIAKGRNAQWAWPSFMEQGGVYTDEYCRSSTIPSEMALQAHSAPLGIVFYKYRDYNANEEKCFGAFPPHMDGYAFVAYHGSWNRDIPTGYKVVYVPINNSTGRVLEGTNEPIDLLTSAGHDSGNAPWESGFRPVDVDFDSCGRLLLSSDGSKGKGTGLVRISYLLNDYSVNDTFIPQLNYTSSACAAGVGGVFMTEIVFSLVVFWCFLFS